MRRDFFNELVQRTYLAMLLIFALITFILIFAREKTLEYIGILIAYLSPLFRKETIIPIAVLYGFDPLFITITFSILDMVFIALLLYNWDLVWKIPYIGRAINYLETQGKKFLEKHPGIREVAFTTIIISVILPLRGMESFIIGKILGLSGMRLFNAILIGTVFSNMLLSFSLSSIKPLLDKIHGVNIALIILGVLSLIFLIDFNKLAKLPRVLRRNRKIEKLEKSGEGS
jgi:hypothetical protein